jgi:hypothetical protein
MIVVSDTTPLRHLIAIGEAELLPELYGTVIVPGAVWAELQAEATPLIVKTWLGSAPDWLEVRSSAAKPWTNERGWANRVQPPIPKGGIGGSPRCAAYSTINLGSES